MYKSFQLYFKENIFTKILFTTEQKKLLHARPHQLLASIRQHYGPMKDEVLLGKLYISVWHGAVQGQTLNVYHTV